MASELDIDGHHHSQLVNYLRFWRYQKSSRIRAVASCVEDIQTQSLQGETTLTVDEVQDMLGRLLVVVSGEMEEELRHTGHTNVLLLRQLFQQAEKWHLKLTANISDLENKELLDKIKDFEDVEFAGMKADKDMQSLLQATKLAPLMVGSGSIELLHKKIEELQIENIALKQKMESAAGSGDDKGKSFELQIQKLSAQLDEMRAKDASNDLEKTLSELKQTQNSLAMTQQELEKKAQETVPFKNMKTMLQKKNEQIKELRQKLMKHEPVE